MARDSGFWNWPIDHAAAQNGTQLGVIGVSALYALGAALLVAQLVLVLPTDVTLVGAALVLLGVVASGGVLWRVIAARSRLSAH